MGRSRDERSRRVSAYAALAGGIIPAAAAAGAIVGQSGLNLVATPGNPQAIDFGGDFGQIFQFSVYQASGTFDRWASSLGSGYGVFFHSYGVSSTSSQVIQFLPNNPNGWYAASLVPYGYDGDGNDPRRLASSFELGPQAPDWYQMTSSIGTWHDLAAAHFRSGTVRTIWTNAGSTTSSNTRPLFNSGSYGEFAPNERGFIGVQFTNGADTHFAWFDVTADLDNNQIIIHGWALNDTPDGVLHVPTPGATGLALLALGAAGVRRHRRLAA